MIDFDEEKQNKELEEFKAKEEEELVSMLAETKYGLPYVDLYRFGVDNEALRAISEEDAKKFVIAPFKLAGEKIYIALRSPTEELKNFLTEDMARKKLTPVFYMTSKRSIEKVWEKYIELSMAASSKIGGINISAEILRETAEKIKTMLDIKNLIREEVDNNKKHKITRILEIILAGAIAIRASDIHIEPGEETTRLRLRLDGVLQDVSFLKSDIYHLLNSRIKLLSGMKLTSKNAQDGRFSIMEDKEEISIRTSLIPGAHGETIVMRILDPKSIQINIEDLDMEPNLYKLIMEEIKKPNGLFLITGPTGSGKTTSLYAFIKKIYSSEINIIIIEDPIEYKISGVTQTQVNKEEDYDFLEGLRAALRQDPDVIMVGEIRDAETAKTAVQSSLTGHMVFSTLHTNNAAGVIPRLVDLNVNPKILASALTVSMAQRLVRRLCSYCKQEEVPTEHEIKTIKRNLDEIVKEGKDLSKFNLSQDMEIKSFKAGSCDKCNMTGYNGRIGIFEAIRTDEEIEKIMPKNPSERDIKEIGKKQGTLSMQQDGILKILKGVTSFEEVMSVVDLSEE